MRLLRKFADMFSCSAAARKLPIRATSRNIRTKSQFAIRPGMCAPAGAPLRSGECIQRLPTLFYIHCRNHAAPQPRDDTMTALDLDFLRKTTGKGTSEGRPPAYSLDRMTALQLAKRTVIFTVDAGGPNWWTRRERISLA